MSTLVIDIESLPLAAALAQPYPEDERPYPSNYKSVEAIESWREKDRAAWSEARVRECSLTPRLGRICCVGTAKDDEPVTTCLAVTEHDERLLLERTWDRIVACDCLVTFSGGFDLRFIVVRSLINGLNPATLNVAVWFQRYRTSPHFDCRAVLTGWDDRQSGKLNEWCASFGIPSENGTTGADVYGLAQAGEWAAIAAHCKSDVSQTRALYRRVAPLFT